jgi:hypothetical protein
MQYAQMVRIVCGAIAAGLVVPALAAAQAGQASSASRVPRTPWGKPDLQGVWDFRSLTPMERPKELADKQTFTPEEAAQFEEDRTRRESRDQTDAQKEAAAGRVVPYNDFWFDWGTKVTSERTSLVIDPPDGRIPPLTPQAIAKRAARAEARKGVGTDEISPNGWIEELSAPVRCLVGFNAGPPVTPSAYNNNLQIIQTPDHVVIFVEMIHHARVVPLDGRPHLPQHIRQWMGSSRGRWEGDTLVVETTNRREDGFRGSTQDMKLTERFTRRGDGTLEYRATIDDPQTWTRPWTFMVPLAQSDENIYEYACHEANYYMENMLKGMRVQEEEAKSAR